MRLTVGKKLLFAFGVVFLSFLLIAGLSLNTIIANNDTLTAVEQETELINAYNEASFQTVRANAAIRGYMLYAKEHMLENHYEIRGSLHEAIDKIQSLAGTDADFEQYLKQLDEWETPIDEEIVPTLQAGNLEEASEIALPILGEGSTKLVVFGKTMAAEKEKEIEERITAIKKASQAKIKQIIVSLVVVLLISIAIAYFLGRTITDNIAKTIIELDRFAQGDLHGHLSYKSKDEFSQLADSFNSMTEKLRVAMNRVGNSSGQVSATAEELSANSLEVTKATEVVTTSIQEIAYGVDDQNNRNQEVVGLSERIFDKIESIAENTKQSNEATTEAIQFANVGRNSMAEAIEQMEDINAHTTTLSDRMQVLSKNTSVIDTAVEAIKEIADQTNLLAINASIEAARSGEHGKGFAVVAEEVRKLADESHIAALEIEKVVTQITNYTEQIEQDIDNNTNAVRSGRETVQTARSHFEQIDGAVGHVQSLTESVNTAIQSIHEDISQLKSEMHVINDVALQSSDNIQSVAASSEEQSASTEEVAAAANYLAEMASELQEIVEAFKY